MSSVPGGMGPSSLAKLSRQQQGDNETSVTSPPGDSASNVPVPTKRISVLKKVEENAKVPSEQHIHALSRSRIFQNADADEEGGRDGGIPVLSRAVMKDFQAAAKAREELIKTIGLQRHPKDKAEVKSVSVEELGDSKNLQLLKEKYEHWKRTRTALFQQNQAELPSKEEQWEFAAGYRISEENACLPETSEEGGNQAFDCQTVGPAYPVLNPCQEQLKTEDQLYYCAEANGNEIGAGSTVDVQRERGAKLSKNNLSTLEKRLLNEGKELTYEPSEEKKSASLSAAPVKACIDEGAPTVQWVHCESAKKDDSSKAGVTMFELVITLSKLMFSHHSLFSKEDLLCHRLLELYNMFQSRLRENLSYHYAQQLALVRSRIQESKTLPEKGDDQGGTEREKQVEALFSECRELRRRRNEEEAKDHLLFKKIVSTWNNIKRLRKAQRYTTTSFKLTLQKYEVDEQRDRDAWKMDLLDDLEEREYESKEKQAKDDPTSRDGGTFDSEAVWTEIYNEALRTRRNPGEPLLLPLLGSSASITPIDQCPIEEKSRRQEITKHKVMLKLFYNGKEVCSTAPRPLNLDFCVALGSTYSLLVREWPKSITLKLYESIGYDWNYLATIGVPLPSDGADISEADQVSEIEFSSELRVIYAHSAVGAGELVRLEEFGVPALIPRISGVLRLSVGWGKGKDGNPLVPGRKNVRRSEADAKVETDAKAAIAHPVQANVYSTSSVRLSLQPMVCELATKEGMSHNAAYRVMSLRSDKTFDGSQLASSTRIDEDAKEQDVQGTNELGDYKELEVSRRLAEKAQSVRFCLLHWLTHHKQQTYETIVSLEKGNVFSVASGQSFRTHRRSFAQPPLPLKGGTSIDGQFRLIVHLNRCYNIPARSDKNVVGAKVPSGARILKQVTYIFIVRFRGKWAQSTFADGPNPIWNQTIIMMIRLFNSAQMGFKASDSLRLDLFEQESTEIPKDMRKDHHTVCHNIERRWLGQIKISLSSIIAQKRLYGSFELVTPKWLLNYQVQKEKQGQHAFNRCYAQLSICIEPIPHIGQLATKLFHSEDEQLINYGQRWLKVLCKKHRCRNYMAFVFDMHGRSVFIPRYLRRIQPPPEVASLKSNKRAAALFACRLVSLIPRDNDVIVKPEIVQIWSTIEETLQTMRAQEAEHATLLCCWLLGMDIPCYLLLGTDTCNGPYAAYVMVYERNDPLCPIRDVACAVTRDNIWANVQKSGHPASLSFNFMNSVYWVPFWSKQFEQRQLPPVQPETLVYSPPNTEMSLNLETRLRKVVTEHLMKWRPESLTRFNRFAGQCFREVLIKMEEGTVDPSGSALFTGAVKTLFNSYNVIIASDDIGLLANVSIS